MNRTIYLHLYSYTSQSYTQTLLINVSRTIFGFLALTGNGFILYTIARNPKVRQNLCNLLIGILALADLWTGTSFFIGSGITLSFQLFEWYSYTKRDCLIIQFFVLTGVQMSQIATVFIALDRLKAVQDPMLYSAQNRIQRFTLAFSFTLLYSLIATSFIFVGADLNEYATLFCQAGTLLSRALGIYWHSFAVCVAIIVIICYVTTSRTLTKKLAHASNECLSHELTKQRAVFRTISIVLIVYGLCWCLPNFITLTATLLGVDPVLLGQLTPIIAVGTGIYSSANVLVYAWKHKELGAAMRNVCLRSNATEKRQNATEKQQNATDKQQSSQPMHYKKRSSQSD